MFLSIGINTTEVESVLIDDGQTIIGTAHVGLPPSRPRPGWSDQDPADWWKAGRITGLTPPAADPVFQSRTAGLVAAPPYLDKIADGASIDGICAQVLDLANERAAA